MENQSRKELDNAFNPNAEPVDLVSVANTNFYHSTRGIHAALLKLQKSCEHAELSLTTEKKTVGDYSVAIDVVNIHEKGKTWG